MDASPRCIELIHGSEGFKTKLPDGRYKSYLDRLAKPNVWTIYCGLTKNVGPDTIWTVEQCEKAFSKEMAFYEDSIERMVTVQLNQNQFDALVSLVYNIGPGDPAAKRKEDRKGFYWSTLRTLLNQGKYEAAAGQFNRYIYAGGKVWPGLVTRRAKEAALFLEPMATPLVPDEERLLIPQVVDAPAPAMTTTEAIKTSPTVAISGTGLLGMAYLWLQQVFGFASDVVKEAGPQVLETQKDLSPFAPILKLTPVLLSTLVVGTLIAAAWRQILKRRAGTTV